MAHLQYLPGDPRLVDQLVYELKSKGIFDQFRKECISDVDTRPAYQNLRQRVESSVATFLSRQVWKPDLNKNQLREKLRKHLLDGNYLEQGVERIVDQVVNPKVASVFIPQVEDVVYNYLGIPRKKSVPAAESSNGKICDDLLPTDLEAVSPGSVKSNDDKTEAMDTSESKDDNMEIDEDSKVEIKEDSVIIVDLIDKEKSDGQDSRLSAISELTIHDSNSVDKNTVTIPLPAEDIKLESIPAPENSPPNIKNKKIDLEKINLPMEPNPSTDIPLPDELPKEERDSFFKPLNLTSEDDDSSSDSSLRRNMSPLTPIRNFNNENSCDAQQAFDNDVDCKSEDKKEPSSFRFTIEAQSSEIESDAIKPEKKEVTEPLPEQNLAFEFAKQANINTFNTPLYDDSSNSNNLQIDYESDANSKTPATDKVIEADQNSGDLKKDKKTEDKKSSHKSSHHSRDSHRHSSSKDKRSDSKHSSSRDGSRQDKKTSKDDKSKTTKERSSDRSGKKDSRDSSKHRSSHKSSSHKDSKHRRSSSSSKHLTSSSRPDDKKSSSSVKDKSDKTDRSKDKSKDSKSNSYRSDKDRKSSKSKEEKENKEKKEKKETDDHYSLSGRGNPNRRSTDRDSNDGSSSSKGSQNPSSTKSSESKKDKKSSSKSDNTSTNSDSTSPSDSTGKDQVINETNEVKNVPQPKPIVRVETHLETPMTSPPRLPFVPDVTLKKPRFAANLAEAKKMMKMRKFLEEEQKRMNQEAALLLEFQANVRPSLSQVYSSIPGPELEFACVSSIEQPTHTQTMVVDEPDQNIQLETKESYSKVQIIGVEDGNLPTIVETVEEANDTIAETLIAMHRGDASICEENTIKENTSEINKQTNDTLMETLNSNKDEALVIDEGMSTTETKADIDSENISLEVEHIHLKSDLQLDEKKLTEFEVTIITEELSESEDTETTNIEPIENPTNSDENPLQYFAEHEKYNAELERDKFSKFLQTFINKTSSNNMYLINCDSYEENLIKEVSQAYGKFKIINYYKNGYSKLPKATKNIVKNVNVTTEINLPVDSFDKAVFSPVKSECSFELSSDYDAKLEEMVNRTSRQEIMEIILGSVIYESPSKMPKIDYCTDSNIDEINNCEDYQTKSCLIESQEVQTDGDNSLKRKILEVESTVNNNRHVLTPNKIRKLSGSDQISSTTEEVEETPNRLQNNTRSKYLGKAKRVGLPRPKRTNLPNSPSSDKSVENYEHTDVSVNGKLRVPRPVQRYDTADLYKPKLHYLSRRNNIS